MEEGQEPPIVAAKKPTRVENCYEWVSDLISALIVVVLVFTFLFRIMGVTGPSMLPTLHSEDRIVLTNLFYRPQAGDIVIISHTRGLNEPIIKRIIATEGQVVNIDFHAGRVYVDGQILDESGYIENGITTQGADFEFPLTVPPGHVFVMGDNRAVSNDSRSRDVGMVDQRLILGKAVMIVFPFDRFGKIA